MIGIIGAGPAGISAAETIRKFDAETPITIFSSEPYPPYNPALLTTFLKEGGNLVFWKGENILNKLKIDAKLGEKVDELEISRQKIVRTEKGEYEFDKVIIATGSKLYSPLKGLNLKNVYNFKSMRQVEELRKAVSGAKKAVVVGAGFQGTEISLTLSELGLDVTLIEAKDRIMPDRFDKKTSKFVEEVLDKKGVEIVFETPCKEFSGDVTCESVVAEDGREFKGDLFVAATGIQPNVDFCRKSLKVERGVIVNEYMETSAKGVFACGDVCETINRVTGERGVFGNYWNAVRQGKIAGMNLCGMQVRYDGSDVVNSLKKLGFHLIAAGDLSGNFVELEENGNYRRFYLKNGILKGYILVGDISAAGIYFHLMINSAVVCEDVLVEPFKSYHPTFSIFR